MGIIKLENGLLRTSKRRPVMVESVEQTDESDTPIEKTKEHLYEYGCVMLPVNDDISAIVRYWCKKNINTDDLYINEDEGIEGFEDSPHVTVKYGIVENDISKISDIIEGYDPITIKCGNVEIFDTNPKFDVVKIHITGDKLQKLHDMLSEKNDGDSFPEYKPHLTLAYVQKGKGKNLIDNDFFDKLEDTIDQVLFVSKDGNDHYIDL